MSKIYKIKKLNLVLKNIFSNKALMLQIRKCFKVNKIIRAATMIKAYLNKIIVF
jgi:hypothetical protein